MMKIEFENVIRVTLDYNEGLLDFYDFIMSLDKDQLQDLVLWEGKTKIVKCDC